MLKQLLIIGCTILCGAFTMYAQEGLKRKCPSQEIFEEQNNNPKTAERRKLIAEHTRAFTERRKKGLNARTGVLTIPVTVHVIYRTGQENISNAQIQSQIDVLNEDFRKMNSDVSDVPSEFSSLASDLKIEFTLVQVTRKSSTRTSWGTNDAMKKSSQGGVDPVDPAHNMNMWICNIGGGILGYAQFPGGPASTDGVVFSPQYCGSIDKQPAGETFYLSAPFDKGRTATHEVGHYLNLRHIWGDGNCSVDDYVPDTPIAADANYGCPSYPSKSCSNNGGFTSDMFMNYMDYVDDACMFMFTAGQKARMDAVLDPGGARSELGTTSGGCSLPAPGGLASSNVGDNTFKLTWNAVSGAVSYDVSVDGDVTTVSGTSITFNGLTAGTTYNTMVRANCSSSTGVYSSTLQVTTTGTGSNCVTGPVKLTLVLDNYPSETSWTLKSGSTTVASGNGYSTSGQTINQTFNVSAGTYIFTINDAYDDGICCSYGNGSYTLRDANDNVIASGGSFGSSESVSYCTEGSAGDTQAPSAPGNLSTSDVTSSAVTLSWSASSDNLGVIGYNIYTNGSLSGTTSSTSYTVTGLSPGKSYAFVVKAKDAANNLSASASANASTLSLTLTYCASQGNATSDEWIQKVVLGSINNTSGANGGYADYTSQSVSINKGSDYSITITPAWSGPKYREAYAVWIDYNQDGDFNDSGEKVYSRSRTTRSSISGTFTVPSSAFSGPTRMRIAMKYNANPTPCETFSYGEVEDYTVTIGGTARSIAEVGNTFEISLFPNPARNETTVSFRIASGQQDIVMSIVDGMGRMVYTNTIIRASGNHDETIDIRGFRKGFYHILIRGNNIKATKNLIID